MGPRIRFVVSLVTGAALVGGVLGGVPASAEDAPAPVEPVSQPATETPPPPPPPPTVTCAVTAPGNPVVTLMDTPVGGNVSCVHSGGLAVAMRVAPLDIPGGFGPEVGRLAFDPATGNFRYEPGFYPPTSTTGTGKLPEYTGSDHFTIIGEAGGVAGSVQVNISIKAPPRSCDAGFVPKTRTMFNDPAGSRTEQFQMLRYLIDMIDCVPAANPDGTQATIRVSFYSMTYAPFQAALSRAAARGVSVKALTNSHADKYDSWVELAKDLGPDTHAVNFATTCWAGCLTPRSPAPVGGPTAWYAAKAASKTSNVVTFGDRSIPGAAPIVRWQWDFGNGSAAEGPGPHVVDYGIAGTYKTSLTVTDSAGLTHTIKQDKTLPDILEPMYPSMHSKIYLLSTVGQGANARRWVSAYSSGNPTYYQSLKGFNNLNVAVGDKTLYDLFMGYEEDLLKGSRGEILTPNYYRSAFTPGNPATGAEPTTVHFMPRRSGDVNVEILKSVKCRYRKGKKLKRTTIRVSMFVFTRKAVAAQLWKLAMRKGCNVEIVYTQMSQRLKGADGKWLTNEDGEPTGYGAADCLATPPTKVVVKKATRGRPARRVVRKNNLRGPDGYCSGGALRGYVPVTSTGVWLNRKSPYKGGRLKVRMSCPVKPKYDPVKKIWSVDCIRKDIFTHHKVMLVKGYIRGKAQKYVMTGSANWSSPGLRSSDELITEIQSASALYKQYMRNYRYLKKVVARNSIKKRKKTKTFLLNLSSTQQLDVSGMSREDLRGQD